MNTETNIHADKTELQRKRRNPIPAEVEAIRTAYAKGGISQAELAEQFGLTRYSIWRLVHGKTRAKAGGPVIAKTRRTNCKLDENTIRAIRLAFAVGGVTRKQLAAKYQTTYQNICALLIRRTWEHIPAESTSPTMIIEQFQSRYSQPVDPSRRLSDADAMRLFSIQSSTDGDAA